MFCALSGTTPKEPVINKKTGHVYEKHLIEKWLESNGNKDPVVPDSDLTQEDLLPIKSVNKIVPPRPTTATSIPSMLQLFQNEWDAVMVETYTLKQQLDSVRQELAHALYQHDAACRVIARLIKERDEARNTLASLKGSGAVAQQQGQSGGDAMEVEGGNMLSEEVRAKMTSTSQELAKDRKKRQASPTLATAEQIKNYTSLASPTLHKTTNPGVACVDIHPNQNLFVTGGLDGGVILFSKDDNKIMATMSEHKGKVTDVQFHPSPSTSEQVVIFSTSQDKTAKMWIGKEGNKSSFKHSTYTIKVHTDNVVGCAVHPTFDYWLTASRDGSWAFHEIESGSTLAHVSGEVPVSGLGLHPDGLLLGAGTADGSIKIWDIKTQKNAATFTGHAGDVVAVSFSENGYYMASASPADNVVMLWDLRKQKTVQTISDLPKNFAVAQAKFDYSGSYLAVSGTEEVRVYMGKTFNHIATLKGHKDVVTDVQWGADAQFLASVSLDRHLKIWGSK